MKTKISELEKLEDLILGYRKETDAKKKQVLYLNLVENSLKLVKKIVANMYPLPQTVSREDLIQVGAVGILKAIETYESIEKGSFKTYATKYIKGKVMHYLRDKANIVKPPRQTVENFSKVKAAIDILSTNLNSDMPSVKDIASFTNLPINTVEEIIKIETLKNTVSLDQNIYTPEGSETLLDRIQADDDSYEQTFENKKIIEFALNKLPKIEKEVIYKYYIEGLNKKEIAKQINISAMQVARIIKRALSKMYNIITNDTKEI